MKLCSAFGFNIKKILSATLKVFCCCLYRVVSPSFRIGWKLLFDGLVPKSIKKIKAGKQELFIASDESSHICLRVNLGNLGKSPCFLLLTCPVTASTQSGDLLWTGLPVLKELRSCLFSPSRSGRVKLLSSCLALKGSKAAEKPWVRTHARNVFQPE